MGAGPTTGADRETVLRWMDKNGKGYMAAATHFGLPVQRVKNWHVRRTHREPTVNPPESAKVADGAKGEGKTPATPPVSRARPPLPPDLAEKSRAAVRSRLEWLASPASVTDTRSLKIALTLKAIVEATPDAITQATEKGNEGADHRTDALTAAFGVPSVPLQVMQGGKAEAQ